MKTVFLCQPFSDRVTGVARFFLAGNITNSPGIPQTGRATREKLQSATHGSVSRIFAYEKSRAARAAFAIMKTNICRFPGTGRGTNEKTNGDFANPRPFLPFTSDFRVPIPLSKRIFAIFSLGGVKRIYPMASDTLLSLKINSVHGAPSSLETPYFLN